MLPGVVVESERPLHCVYIQVVGLVGEQTVDKQIICTRLRSIEEVVDTVAVAHVEMQRFHYRAVGRTVEIYARHTAPELCGGYKETPGLLVVVHCRCVEEDIAHGIHLPYLASLHGGQVVLVEVVVIAGGEFLAPCLVAFAPEYVEPVAYDSRCGTVAWSGTRTQLYLLHRIAVEVKTVHVVGKPEEAVAAK